MWVRAVPVVARNSITGTIRGGPAAATFWLCITVSSRLLANLAACTTLGGGVAHRAWVPEPGHRTAAMIGSLVASWQWSLATGVGAQMSLRTRRSCGADRQFRPDIESHHGQTPLIRW